MFTLALWISCQGDIALIYSDKNKDTGQESTLLDDQIDDTDSEDETDDPTDVVDPSGVSGYFYLELQQLSCPQCFFENREINIDMGGFFHETISDSHFNGSLLSGECTTNDFSYRPSYNLITHTQSLSVSGTYYDFNLFGSQEFSSNQMYENQYERDTVYTVRTDYGSFDFLSIHGFDFIEPYTMLYVDPSYAFAAPISRGGQSFSWGPSGSNSMFEISIEVFSYDGSQFLGLVTCASQDTGFMNIPSSYLSQYPQGSLAAIILTRHKRDSSVYAPLNSYIETHMRWRVVGTGYIY